LKRWTLPAILNQVYGMGYRKGRIDLATNRSDLLTKSQEHIIAVKKELCKHMVCVEDFSRKFNSERMQTLYLQVQKIGGPNLRKLVIVPCLLALVLLVVPAYAQGVFDEFGYNYGARVFVGKADGVDRVLDGTVWGDPTYANDWLVMKWSKAWDDARFHGAAWGPDAWENNEWNGNVPGGSGEVWHYKIIWVGSELENSVYWREGGYAIWGQFEVIMDQGTSGGEHMWYTLATPNGFGGPYK